MEFYQKELSEDLQLLEKTWKHWKSEKRAHPSKWSISLLFTSFSKILVTEEKRLTGQNFSTVDLCLTFLTTSTIDESFQQSGKQDFFRHIMKTSACMYESLDSLEPPQKHNQDQACLTNKGWLWPYPTW